MPAFFQKQLRKNWHYSRKSIIIVFGIILLWIFITIGFFSIFFFLIFSSDITQTNVWTQSIFQESSIKFSDEKISYLLRGVHPNERKYYRSENGSFTCFRGKTKIPFSWVNDNYCDCSDSTDEPGTSACFKEGTFFCKRDSKYIPSSHVDDSICDCSDGEDELEIWNQLQKQTESNPLSCLSLKERILFKLKKV